LQANRTKNTLKNATTGIAVKLISTLLAFAERSIFIYALGIQYAGVSGVFTDVLNILSFAELGIGTAIVYALYKPIATNDTDKINRLMNFYKMAYRMIALIVFVVGLVLLPFLRYIITDVPDVVEDIRLIYILYIIKTAVSYLFVYKTSFLIASQREYTVSKIKIITSIFQTIAQCLLLVVFKKFIIYLLFAIVMSIVVNLVIARKANVLYPFLKNKEKKTIDKSERSKLFKDVRALFLYKVSGVILNGTDSIVISSFVGTGVVGMLGNYNLILHQVYYFITQIFTAASASIGNLAASESSEKQYTVFRKMVFLCFWICSFCCCMLANLLTPFVNIWQSGRYNLSSFVVVLLVMDLFMKGMMSPVSSFRTSNGLFQQGKYRPLAMAIINIVVSIILAQQIGLPGVLIGTVFSRLVTQVWYDPLLVYKHVFKKSVKGYYLMYLGFAVFTAICCAIPQVVFYFVRLENIYVDFLFKMAVSAIVPITLILIFFWRTKEFKGYVELVRSMIKRKGMFSK